MTWVLRSVPNFRSVVGMSQTINTPAQITFAIRSGADPIEVAMKAMLNQARLLVIDAWAMGDMLNGEHTERLMQLHEDLSRAAEAIG